MKSSDSGLFQLIKTLTKTEKTYFKRSAFNAGESKIYLNLFDAIDKQDVYDEKKLREEFKNVKQFSVLKIQLYENVLDSLRRLADSVSFSYNIACIIKNAEQLFNKGLYFQSEKLLTKAKAKAYEAEEFISVLQAINLQKKLILKQIQQDEQKVKFLHKEEDNALTLIKNLSEYNELFTNTYLYFLMYGYIRGKKDEERFLKNTGIKDFEKHHGKPLSKRAEQYYYETMHLYYTAMFDTNNAMKFNTVSLKLMEDNPGLIKANVERYLATFQNHVLQYFYKGDIKNMESAALRLKAFLNEANIHIPKLARITAQGKLYNILLSAYHGACEFEKADEVLKESEVLLDKNFSLIDKSVKNITYQMGAFNYFTMEDYDDSLRLVNKLLNDPDSLKFLEVYCFILLLQLLIHYEMGNYDLIEYISKSTMRYLSKKEKLFKIEKIMLSFFSKVIYTGDDEKITIIKQLYDELIELKNNPEESSFEYFDFAAWCESKIRKVKLRLILTEKYEKSLQKAHK